jgi:trk system potassium uptake protein TrkA
MVNDYISIGNGEFVVEIEVSERLDGMPLDSVLKEVREAIHVLVVKRKTQVTVHPPADFKLQSMDILVLLGQLTALKNIAPKLV